jgi:hypothetical protein
VSFPSFVLAIGTGLAIAVARSEDRYTVIYINRLPNSLLNDEYWRTSGIFESSHIHSPLASPFFKEGELVGDRQRLYGERLEKLLSQLLCLANRCLGIEIKHLMVGGGFANVLKQSWPDGLTVKG